MARLGIPIVYTIHIGRYLPNKDINTSKHVPLPHTWKIVFFYGNFIVGILKLISEIHGNFILNFIKTKNRKKLIISYNTNRRENGSDSSVPPIENHTL